MAAARYLIHPTSKNRISGETEATAMKQFVQTHLRNFISGIIIGAAMLIPGVSGGTTAIILGVYDRLVAAVASFFKDVKKNIIFLAVLAVGGVIGLLGFSKLLLKLVELWEVPMLLLFIGATSGSFPLLVKKSRDGFKLTSLLWLVVGFACIFGISQLPESLFAFDAHSLAGFATLFVLGIPLAVALVLPGISFSYMMLVFSIYDPFLAALSSLDIAFLAPLGLGLVAGVLLTTKILEKTMQRFPGPTYFAIIGFMFGSILEIVRSLPHVPNGWEIPACVLTFAIGAVGVWLYSRNAE